MADKRFVHESLQDAQTIKSLLGALAKGLAKGEVTLADDKAELLLKTAGLLTVRIKAAQEDGQNEINLRLRWSDPDCPPPAAQGAPRIES